MFTRKKIGLAFLVLLLAAGMVLWTRGGGVPGDLYRYYPASTGFYLELAPGEKLTRRFLAYLDEQATLEDKSAEQPPAQSATPGRRTPEKTAAGSDAIDQAAREALKARQRRFRHAFLQKFNETFDPYFSLGAWPDPAAKPNATQLAEGAGYILIIFPLKENLTPEAVLQRFDLPLSDFDRHQLKPQRGGVMNYLTSRENGVSLAVLDQKLLIANSAETMTATLRHGKSERGNVYDNPNNRTFLAHLPRFRQGTFVMNNSVYAQKALDPETLGRSLGRQVAGMSGFLPLTVGAIDIKAGNVIGVRFITPLLLDALPNAAMKADLQALYQDRAHFDQARRLPADTRLMVGFAGADRIFDFYRDFLLTPEADRYLKVSGFFLNGFRLDLRKDVVGLLENRTVLASRNMGQKPALILMTDKDDRKDKTLDKLSALFASNAFPIKQKTEQVGDYSIRTLSVSDLVPNRRTEAVSYGTVGNSLVFATPVDFLDTLNVSRGQTSALSESPLYENLDNGMPATSSAFVFFRPGVPGQQRSWLEALSLALWAEPFRPDQIDLLHGQLNIQLSAPKS